MNTNRPQLLSISGLSKEFPGVKALDNVRLDIEPGEVHALCGENGAGKSTLIKILAGVYTKDAGEIIFDGKPIEIQSPHQSLQIGIKVVFQELALLPEMSVSENIFVESFPIKANKTIDWAFMNKRSDELLREVGICIDTTIKLGQLTVAQQQMVEIARALSHDSKLIIMDEPTSALTPNEVEYLFEVIRKMKKRGVSILYVSHKLEEIMEIGDRVTTFRDGRYIVTRSVDQTSIDEIVKDMVGREIEHMFPHNHEPTDQTVLEARNLSTTAKLRNLSFDVHKGEVLGVFGLMGAGRTELAKALFGVDRISSGSVSVNGRVLRNGSTSDAVKSGLGLITEDRKQEGILNEMSVAENMTLPTLTDFSRFGFISRPMELRETQKLVDRFQVKTPSLRQKIMYLSGGNQQKVLLARWMMKKLDVVILDEPTRGIDVGAKSEIHGLIDELAQGGVAVLVMTSELPELLGISDRIMVLNNGIVGGFFTRGEATQETIMSAAISKTKDVGACDE